MLTPIKCDLHNIGRRLKNINRDYHLFRNNLQERFEVHNSERPSGRTLCFVVPYNELDERTLTHAMRTSKNNFDELVVESDNHNRRIYESAEQTIKQQQSLLADMMEFAASGEQEVVFSRGAKWF